MIDFYLSFADESAAKAVLYTTHPAQLDDAGNETAEAYDTQNFINIDTIGVIYNPTGEVTQTEDGEVPVMAAIPGWHVNVRVMPGEDGSVLEPFAVQPATPRRLWA